ncbi:MAG: hypothetical protein HOO86_08205 [Bacteroidales bacterium]|nr:hypothetical protein [Bacteroidales bacterium]
MKTLITSAVFCILFSTVSFAQLDKGYWLGNVVGNFGISDKGNFWFVNLNTQSLKLVDKNLAIGLGIDYNYYKSNVKGPQNTGAYRHTYLEIGPVVRKYLGNSRCKPYAELSTGIQMFNSQHLNSEFSYLDEQQYKFFLNPTIGVSWWFNENVSLNLSTGFKTTNFNNIMFDGFRIGVSFKIGKMSSKK